MEELQIERLAHATSSGTVEACVWKSLTSTGPEYRFTLHRPYRGPDSMKSSSPFHPEDASHIARLVHQVAHWIANEKATAEARIRLAGQGVSSVQLAAAAEKILLED